MEKEIEVKYGFIKEDNYQKIKGILKNEKIIFTNKSFVILMQFLMQRHEYF